MRGTSQYTPPTKLIRNRPKSRLATTTPVAGPSTPTVTRTRFSILTASSTWQVSDPHKETVSWHSIESTARVAGYGFQTASCRGHVTSRPLAILPHRSPQESDTTQSVHPIICRGCENLHTNTPQMGRKNWRNSSAYRQYRATCERRAPRNLDPGIRMSLPSRAGLSFRRLPNPPNCRIEIHAADCPAPGCYPGYVTSCRRPVSRGRLGTTPCCGLSGRRYPIGGSLRCAHLRDPETGTTSPCHPANPR